ncbi:hypothetical protein [Lysobacter sp. cf310]|uniref:hypothetical protein n=1 Tax=Lysobacter sp. cf310 TaxID=1761790 RepID=UPI001113BEBA|nr:hypothetical protein [Lysobacter sp. cf310]
MNYYYVTISAALVLVVLSLSLFFRRVWVRVAAIGLLYFGCLFAIVVDMGGLRAKVDAARKHGKSEDFVSGIVAEHHEVKAARIEALLYVTGLLVLGASGWLRRHRGGADTESPML